MTDPDDEPVATSAGGASESVSWAMYGPDGELKASSESEQRDEEDDDH